MHITTVFYDAMALGWVGNGGVMTLSFVHFAYDFHLRGG